MPKRPYVIGTPDDDEIGLEGNWVLHYEYGGKPRSRKLKSKTESGAKLEAARFIGVEEESIGVEYD